MMENFSKKKLRRSARKYDPTVLELRNLITTILLELTIDSEKETFEDALSEYFSPETVKEIEEMY